MLFKLCGFYKIPRKLILDLFEGNLTFNQFGLLLIYVGLADWDKRHGKNYAVCKMSNRDLSKIIGLNKTKVAYNKNILQIKRKLEIMYKKGNVEYVRILEPEQYFTDKVSKNKDNHSRINDN
jgi:hypothetical protein